MDLRFFSIFDQRMRIIWVFNISLILAEEVIQKKNHTTLKSWQLSYTTQTIIG